MHFERAQGENDEERKYGEALRTMHRESACALGKQIVMLSTKPKADLDMKDFDDEVEREAHNLRMATDELEMMQRQFMFASQEKDFLRAR